MVIWVGCPYLAVSDSVIIFVLERLTVNVFLTLIKAIIFRQSELVVIPIAPTLALSLVAISATQGLADVSVALQCLGRRLAFGLIGVPGRTGAPGLGMGAGGWGPSPPPH